MMHNKMDGLIARGYNVDIEKAFSNGWQMFKSNPLPTMSYAALIMSLQVVFALYLTDITFVFSVFLAGPLYAGYFLIANKISRGESPLLSDYFAGFQYYLPVVLVWLIGQVLTGFGIVLFVIPGIYLMVGYMFAVLLAIFGGFDFWNALEYSRKIIHVRWWKFFYMMLLLVVMNIIGALLVVVGLLITFPLTFYVIYCLFEDITQEALTEEETS
ncbi:MAG TPA: hypothetical protein VK014_07295 [Cyclobacteriaceae bacterium]|nr:hypothetical protein [Cyclobacteriaceae bacterium]